MAGVVDTNMSASPVVKFSQINTKDYELNRVQNNVGAAFESISNTPTLGGNLLQQVSLVTGTNIINHKLGRNLVGWQLTRQRGAASIYDNQDTNTMQNLTLILVSSANVVIDLYVF